MSAKFLSYLSQNYIELLDDDEYYDVTVEVGKDPNVKIFRAHMNILCYRSPYLRRALSSSKKSNDNNILAHLKLPNISPENFQIILKYIYGGILSFNEQDAPDILKVLIAANKLCLQELVDYLQNYLIENKSEWMEQHFEMIHQASFQFNNFLDLQRFCTDLIAKSPDKVFKSLDLSFLSEKSLISIIKRDDLQMEEIEVWDQVLRWGLAQNPTLTSDPTTWTDDDFKTMENTLQRCLPLIRFFSLHSKDFFRRVRPYKRFLKEQLYENLLAYHLDPETQITHKILPPRVGNLDSKNLDSITINIRIASLISTWIDKVDFNYRELYLPYKFELLLRGSRDGFTPEMFHTLCDNKPMTVAFIKIKGTNELIGGYNPLTWKSSVEWGRTKNSFVFSFKNKDNFIKHAILSNVKNVNYALNYHKRCGPCFGGDLMICSTGEQKDYNTIHCRKNNYEKKLRDDEENFSIEEYEVFQIIRK